jgi:Protein of unknown function (DUF541)
VVPFDEGAGRRPLTWSAYSSATHEEFYHDQQTGRMQRTGQVIATVALRITVRDLDRLDDLSGVLAAAPDLHVHGVTWHVDWDNSAWPQVRAAAIGAAIGKARDYAAALGATVRHVEHIADVGLLGGDTAPYQPGGFVTAKAFGGSGDHPGAPALTPVPQELIATIEARFRTTEVSLPSALGHSWRSGASSPIRHAFCTPSAPRHQRTWTPRRAAWAQTTFAVAGQPNRGSDSQPESGPRKVTRNLILDFATFAWTGQNPQNVRRARLPSVRARKRS